MNSGKYLPMYNFLWKVNPPGTSLPTKNHPRRKYHSPIGKISAYLPISNTICKQWTNVLACSPSPGGSGDQVILKDVVVRSFDYAEQNGYLKIYIYRLWRKKGRGRGATKKGTEISGF